MKMYVERNGYIYVLKKVSDRDNTIHPPPKWGGFMGYALKEIIRKKDVKKVW